MNAIQPQTWEGPVALIETKAGSNVFTIKPRQKGRYSAETVDEILKALLTAKVHLDGWKVWLDGDFEVKLEKGETASPAKLAKFVKEADSIALVYVKTPWPQPKLKFTKGVGLATRKTSANPVREL